MTFTNCNSFSNCLSQIILRVVEVITLYSVFTLNLVITFCFLLFQEIKLSPMETQYPEVDLLSKGDLAQSTSEQQRTLVWLL